MPKRKQLVRTIQDLSKEEGTRQPTADDWLRDRDHEAANDFGADEQIALDEPKINDSDAEAAPSEEETLTAFERRIRLEESAVRRFRQHAAIAFIFGLAALTLVLIVRVNPS